ncbi:DUF2953 domain-containing protein [Ammoniphilus sp. YIM 78166]|uniref:DUF2953 domain-containing protein n=1 Tax=Ammoniphilus sp. YIM 78166 TaxID=1644106 RepID=UPI0010702BEE|nr:DUF2953 domain-containing protein [Ammoniphilus sp. YIM 78166]
MKWFFLIWTTMWISFLLTNVKIIIQYKKRKVDDHIHLELQFLFGLISLKFDIPMINLNSFMEGVPVKTQASSDVPVGREPAPAMGGFFLRRQLIKRLLEFLNRLKLRAHDLQEVTRETLSRVRCERLEWYTRVGLGDAATTGMATGLFWGIKTAIIGVMSHYLSMRTTPRMNIVPAFHALEIDTQFTCILRYRIGNTIIAVVRILFKLIKGREGIWQNTLFRA